MRFDKYDRLERINVAIKKLNEADFTFSSTRRNFTMPPVSIPIGLQADGGSIPTRYSEEDRQKQIQKFRGTAPKPEQKQDKEEQGDQSWIDKAQEVADMATLAGSLIPGLNLASSGVQAISAGIDVGQGQNLDAALRGGQAALGLLPTGRLLSTAGGKIAARGAVLAGEKTAAEEALRVATGAGRRRAQSALTQIERQIADLPPTTGLKAKLPTWSADTTWKPAFKQAGAKYISTTGAKVVGGVLLRSPATLMGGQPTIGGKTDQSGLEGRESPELPGETTPSKPKHKQVEFEGQMWDENLANELKRQRKRDAAVKAAKLRTTMRTPPRKPSGEVDIEAWHTITGMKIPKTYDETKKAIEATKPYDYNPLEVDPSLRSRYNAVKKQVQQNM